MVQFTTLLSLALPAGFAMGFANTSSDPTYGNMASTLLELKAADVVGPIIPEELMSLSGALQVTFGNTTAELGSTMPLEKVNATPTFNVNYTSAVADQQLFFNQLFTVLAFDAGATPEKENATVFKHFLSNNLTTIDGELQNMTGPVTQWSVPPVEKGTGPHRLVQLIFAQGPDFAPISANGTQPPANISFTDYVKQSNLGKIVAANYFFVQNGTDLNHGVTVEPAPAIPAESVSAEATSISASIVAEATGGAKAFKAANTAVSLAAPGSMLAFASTIVLAIRLAI